MAIFRFHVQSIGRGTRRRATDAAAYRSGERLTDERTGTAHDYSHRRDVVHREIVLPSKFDGAEMGWARDRERLWNAAERAEVRRNARVAREYQLSLPHELGPAERQALTTAFAKDLASRHDVGVDVTIHLPRPEFDPRNHHAHLLATTREIRPEGLGRKAQMELSGTVQKRLGLSDNRDELVALRARWAELTNDALRAAQLDVRVDPRSLADQGIDRAPMHQPWHVYVAAQRALREQLGPRVLDQYRSRGSAGTAPVPQHVARDEQQGREIQGQSERQPERPRSLEDIRQEAREAWLRLRAAHEQEHSPEPARERVQERGAEPEQASEPAIDAKRIDDDAAL